MKYRVCISDGALQGVNEFLDYISVQQQQPIAAKRWWQKAFTQIQTLEYLPQRCPYAPENAWSKHELRMLIVDRCLFIFHINDRAQAVEILAFRHGSREPRPVD